MLTPRTKLALRAQGRQTRSLLRCKPTRRAHRPKHHRPWQQQQQPLQQQQQQA
jgi:hypothetical protein